MKKMTKLLGLLMLAALMIQCREDEEITPMHDPNDNDKAVPTDTVSVSGDAAESGNFSFVGEKKNETENGFDVDGALYMETDSAKIAIMEESSFTVTQDAQGNMQSMEGTGAPQMPDLGLFKSFNISDAAEASFVYNTGQYFKGQNDDFKELPLRDTSYYFFFNLVNLASGEKEDMSVKNAQLGVTSYFINLPQQEVIIPTGTFKINTPQGSISVGNDLAIGISAKKSFPFTPQQYADTSLNKVIDEQKAFSDLSGFLYLKGEMSLGKKIPMKISGEAVLDGDLDIIFSEGFASASYSFAMNGNLVFGHDLLDLIPVDFKTKLTNVTLRLDESQTGTEHQSVFKFAGEFDDNAWMETVVDGIAGTNISQYVPFTGNEGSMFASFGENWEFYVNTYFAFNTPHLGKQPTRKGTLHITEKQLGISGAMAIPFVPGELAASGVFGYDGNIHLQAKGDSEIEIEGVKMDANLDFNIYNDKATMAGNINIPYGIGTVDVGGVVDSEGLTFSGSAGNRDLMFKDGFSLPVVGMDIYANLRKTNPEFSLSGKLSLQQLEQPLVDISGTISSQGVEFHGNINNRLKLQQGSAPMSIPLFNVSLTAKTWEGVYFNGATALPFGLVDASFNGYIIGSRRDNLNLPEILLDVSFSSNPTLTIKVFRLPTSEFDMTISSVKGINFSGNVDYGLNLGYFATRGEISGGEISFYAKENKNLKFGGLYFSSTLEIKSGNNLGTLTLADLSGQINTTVGNVKVDGSIDYRSGLSLSGSINAACFDPNLPGIDHLKIGKNFSFSSARLFGGSSYSISASVDDCDSGCSSNCNTITGFSTEIDAKTGKFKVCIPIPVLNPCFSL